MSGTPQGQGGGGLGGSRSPDGSYNPTYKDVLEVREVLASFKLPAELVLDVLERARYWPTQEFVTERAVLVASGWPAHNGAKICSILSVLEAPVLSQVMDEKVKIKEIQWDITSKDQGWTSERTAGTYQSHSWTEVFIMRPASDNAPRPLSDEGHDRDYINFDDLPNVLSSHGWEWVTSPPPESKRLLWRLQNNRVAEREPLMHHVFINHANDKFEGGPGAGHGTGFLKQLQEGDRIVILARAQYPGWLCHVLNFKMRIYYGF